MNNFNFGSNSNNSEILDSFPDKLSESQLSIATKDKSSLNHSIDSITQETKTQNNSNVEHGTSFKDTLMDAMYDAKKEIFDKMRLTVNAIHAMEDNYEDSPLENNSGLELELNGAINSVQDLVDDKEDSDSDSDSKDKNADIESSLSRDTFITCKDGDLESPLQSDNHNTKLDGKIPPIKNEKSSSNLLYHALRTRNDIPLILSFSPVLKRFLKVFILTYGFRSAISIVGSFFSELKTILLSKSILKALLSRDFIKHILVHESKAPYEDAMRIGLFCAGICSIYEGVEMIIRWIWFKILKKNKNLVRKQQIVFQIEKPKSQHYEEELIKQRQNTKDNSKNDNADNQNNNNNKIGKIVSSSEPKIHDTLEINNYKKPSQIIIPGDRELSNQFNGETPISTTPNGEEVIIITKTKTIEYAQRIKWHTAIAGFASGIALCAVNDPESKRTMSLYFFARLLQCVYNFLKRNGHFNKILPKFEHYDSLLFMLSTAQVMYAWVTRRFALPPSYARFITKTGPIHQPVLDTVESIHTRGASVDKTLPNLSKYLSKYYPSNKVNTLVSDIQKTHRVNCDVLHPMESSCTHNFARVTTDVSKKIFPLYGVLTLVSLVLLKRKKMLTHPISSISQGLFNVFRSTAFLSLFVSSYQYLICGQRKITTGLEHRFIYWLSGFIAASSIFIEQKPRRSELALYVLPRGLDALYLILQRRKWLSTVPFGELLLFCLSLSGIMVANFHDRESLGSLPRFVLKTFFSNQIVKWIE